MFWPGGDDDDWGFGIKPDSKELRLDVPYVPTDERLVTAMLELGAVDDDDVLYDLGSGDGRVVVAAAHLFGAQAVGVELDPERLAEAAAYAETMGVEAQVDFIEQDLFLADLTPATVVTLYLLDCVNLGLRPKLLGELRPGTRILSHAFDMGEWRPDQQLTHNGVNVYLWAVPAQVEGSWFWRGSDGAAFRVDLEQHYQQIRGQAWIDGRRVPLRALLWGDLLELIMPVESQAEPVSSIAHCRDDALVLVDGSHSGAVARRVSPRSAPDAPEPPGPTA